jgi:YHS domain-containing protein
MTAQRQQRKRPRLTAAVRAVVLLALAAAALLAPAAATERIVVDRHTGLAIAGYDPVAFYTDGKSMPGDPAVELSYGGAVWRFCNVGNREAFAARPDVYMPQFGGYDPLGVAHGVALAGHPGIWAIAGGRLFLFHDQGRLDKFTADPERFTTAADRKWPDVMQALAN